MYKKEINKKKSNEKDFYCNSILLHTAIAQTDYIITSDPFIYQLLLNNVVFYLENEKQTNNTELCNVIYKCDNFIN